jgi:hypothetical protein
LSLCCPPLYTRLDSNIIVLIPPMRRTFTALSRSTRSFSTSSYRAFPRQPPARAAAQSDVDIPRALRQAAETEGITLEDFREAQTGIRAPWSADDIVENENDASSAGHLYLMQQRQNLRYLRLIEHEMPKLVGERETRNIILIGALSDMRGQHFANRSCFQRQKCRSWSGPCRTAVKSILQP